MGMSASQARLLAITSRMNDIEFKSQQVANTKIRLADESEAVAKAYNTALGKRKYTVTSYNQAGHVGQAVKIDLSYENLTKAGYKLINRADNSVFTVTGSNKKPDAATVYEMIESGQFYLVASDVTSKYEEAEVSVASEVGLADEQDNSDFAKAEAQYTADTAKIKKKEQILDNEMKALDTEHSALKTEMDSVKSLIKDNVDKSFNLFS